jgi:hypothetical protein
MRAKRFKGCPFGTWAVTVGVDGQHGSPVGALKIDPEPGPPAGVLHGGVDRIGWGPTGQG